MAEIYGFAITVEGNAVKSITAIDQSLNNLEKNATKTDSVFGGLFKFEMLKKGLGLLKQGFSEVYNFGKQMEQTMLSFEVMTGSKEKASALQKELKALADISPMVDSAIYGGGKMLLNYGIEADKVGGYLNMLGDISAGDADRFQRLAYVFGQVSAQTRLQGADLRQMIDAGFNPLNEMVKTTGKSYEQLKDDMGKGKISFDMVVNAMKTVTSEGGRFNNMMERQAQTVGGMESTLEGTLQSGMFGLFQRMSPVLKDILGASTEVAQSFADWVTPKQTEVLIGQKAAMNGYFEMLKNANLPLDERRRIIGIMNSEFPDYLKNIITEQTSLTELAEIQKSANQALLKKIEITGKEEVLTEAFKETSKKSKKRWNLEFLQEQAEAGDLEYKDLPLGLKAKFSLVSQKKRDEWRNSFSWIKNDARQGSTARELYGFLNEQLSYAIVSDKQAADEYAKVYAKFGIDVEAFNKKGSLSESQQKMLDALKKQKEDELAKLVGNKDIVTGVKGFGGTDAFTDSANATASMAAGGGLGQAKVINMNFNEPLMQINAGTLDSDDLQADAEKIIEQLTVELHQMAYETGTV